MANSVIRTSFLIDGFNLYHSVRDASRDLQLHGKGTKWLDIYSLCQSYLHLIDCDARLEQVYYFSAFATHLQSSSPGTVRRHREYIQCLRETGVSVELARFKSKYIRCPSCQFEIERHEEKETDVAIAVKLFELFISDQADVIVLVTGDTDIAPAVRSAQQLFPQKEIGFAFPHRRKNKELAQLVSLAFTIRGKNYTNHQLTDPFFLADGSKIYKPPTW